VCHNAPIRENHMGFAFFDNTKLVNLVDTPHNLIKKISDINNDGKEDIIVYSIANDLGGVMTTSIEVIDVSHYRYKSIYSASHFTISYDMACFPTQEYDNEAGKLFVKKGYSPIFRREEYRQPIKKCKSIGKLKWVKTTTEKILIKKIKK
jgi:hypothetical protein